MFGFLYKTAPNVKQPGAKFFTPGGFVALFIWIVASILFAIYVAKFATLNKTYGSMGGIIAFLIWIWITNLAILFGAEFNSELQRSPAARGRRARAAGRAVPGAARHHEAGQEGGEVAVSAGGPVRRVAEAVGGSIDSAAGLPEFQRELLGHIRSMDEGIQGLAREHRAPCARTSGRCASRSGRRPTASSRT